MSGEATTTGRGRPLPIAVLVVGTAAALAVALAIGATAGETATLVATSGGAAAAVMGATTVLLDRLRHRGVVAHLLIVAGAAVAATAAGVAVAARAMFLSGHDLGVLAVVLVLAASTAVAGSLALAGRLGASTRGLTDQVDALDGDRVVTPEPSPATAELGRLSEALAATHAQLVEARRRSGRLERSRRELVAWVSHDLRSPIGAIRAMAEALEDGVVAAPVEVAAYHRALRQEAERLGRLVDDLFELSRIETGAPATDVPFVPLHELVGEIVEAAAGRASAHGVSLLVDVGTVSPELVVAADVRRAVDNVLDNAIHHTPAGGSITVTVHPDGMGLAIVVVDGCGGIPEGDIERIFDVAFRGDASRSRDTGGGGLGLAIAKGLLEARAGAISVRNRAQGCEFTVRLPAEVGS